MKLPHFQIGELFKIFFWGIVIAVPIGLYYIYYSDVQNRYDNQRNFRALNEVSNQLELHLQALEKLFLFTPVNFFSPDKKTDEITQQHLKTYKRRLQTNNFLHDLDLKETDIVHLTKICKKEEVSRFFIDTRATDPSLKVYPCAKVEEETGLKTKKINSCLDKLSQTETQDSDWKCFLNLNHKEQLFKSGGVESINTQEGKLKHLVTLNTIYFKLPLKSLLGTNLPLEFDEILLSDNKGDVIFQEGAEVLEWSDKNASLKTAHQGKRITNINWLLQEASKQIEINNHAKERINTATYKVNNDIVKSQHSDFLLEHSTYIDLSIAGEDYRIYIHPFVIANSLHNWYENSKNPDFNKLYAVGIVKKDRLGGSVFSLPFVYLSVALLLLLLGFLSWPFLRLKFMGIRESISANDLHVMLLSLLFGLVIITLFLLTIFTFYKLEEDSEKQAEKIAKKIEKNFRHDLTEVLNKMNNYKDIYSNSNLKKENDSDKVFSCLSTTCRDPNTLNQTDNDTSVETNNETCVDHDIKIGRNKVFSCLSTTYLDDTYTSPKYCNTSARNNAETDSDKVFFSCRPTINSDDTYIFPTVRNTFALNKLGHQYGPIIYDVDRLVSSSRLKVDFRDYFKNSRDGKNWHFQNNDKKVPQPFYIERIHDFSNGSKASQVTIPYIPDEESIADGKSIAEMEENSPLVIASTVNFPSIAAPVLPASFHFAIIENASGGILYHSEDEKSFVQNLYAESDYNRLLISHAQMRFSGHIEGHYHGNATKFFVLSLTDMPWSVVVYYDLSRLHVLMIKTAVITLFSFILYLLIVLFLFFIFNKTVSQNWDWLWPHHLKSHQYTELIFMLALLSISLLLYVMFVSGWPLFFCLILSVPLILGMVWIFIGDRPNKNKYYDWVFLSCCSILLFSLFPQLNAIQESPREFSFESLALPEQLMNPIALVLLLVIPHMLIRLFWEKQFRQKKHFQFLYWGYSLFLLGLLVFLLVLLLDHPLNLNYNLWYFQVSATVILIILLAKYLFFPGPPVNNKSYNRLRPENYRFKYLVFITWIYMPIAVIPTIGFFKDTFTTNYDIYLRLDQLHFADNMQKRIHTLDKYARMFYPSEFDKPSNKKRVILNDPKHSNDHKSPDDSENTSLSYSSGTKSTYGIYGFTRNSSQNVDISSKGPTNADCPASPSSQHGPADSFLEELLLHIYHFFQNVDTSSKVPTNADCPASSRSQHGPADSFLEELLHINLRFAQQYVVNTDNLINADRWWKEKSLNFTTEDSAGVIRHQITQQAPGFWSFIQPYWPSLLFLIVLIFLGWWLLLTYFSRRVFAIHIPEPIPCRNALPDEQNDRGLPPFNILIRGVDDKFQILLKNSGVTVDPAIDIRYLDILTADFDDSQAYKRILIVDNLDAGIQDPIRRKQALEYLEKQSNIRKQALEYLEKQSNRPSGRYDYIFIRCEIAPLYRLTNPSAYPYVHTAQDVTSLQPDIEEIDRWGKLLAKFMKHYCWEPPLKNTSILDETPTGLSEQQQLIQLVVAECRIWPELDSIKQELELIIKKYSSGLLNKQQVLEYIRTHGNVFYRKRWELCTRDERLCLYQLARGQFINSDNDVVIEHLYRRGYIKRAPYFRIANETFKKFVGTAELIENPGIWETEARKSVWSQLKIPLFIILFCLTGVLLYVASDAMDVTLGLLSGLLAFIPLLLRGINNMKGSDS